MHYLTVSDILWVDCFLWRRAPVSPSGDTSQSRWQLMANSSGEPLGHWPRPIDGGPAGGERMSRIPDTPVKLISLCFCQDIREVFLSPL